MRKFWKVFWVMSDVALIAQMWKGGEGMPSIRNHLEDVAKNDPMLRPFLEAVSRIASHF